MGVISQLNLTEDLHLLVQRILFIRHVKLIKFAHNASKFLLWFSFLEALLPSLLLLIAHI